MVSKKNANTDLEAKQIKQKKDVDQLFTNMGFQSIATDFKIKDSSGNEVTDIDKIYACNDDIIICVELTSAKDISDHFRKKIQIYNSFFVNDDQRHSFLVSILGTDNWRDNFDTDNKKFLEIEKNKRLSKTRYPIRFLYIYQSETANYQQLVDVLATAQKPSSNGKIKIFNERLLKYFQDISYKIQKSSKYEFFSFMGITYQTVFQGKSQTISKRIVIKNTGAMFPKLMENCEIVIFTMSPEELILQATIHRKEGWREDNYLYQRIILRDKIESIRKSLINENMIFINNIIVSLPDQTEVKEEYLEEQQSEENQQLFVMTLPVAFDNINIIDGQHRLFSHYESLKDDIATQRSTNQLFITGIIFPENISELEKRQIEATIFVETNSNQKNIDDILLKEIRQELFPNTIEAVLVSVVDWLNNKSTLLKGLLPSTRDYVSDRNSIIERSSIISFGLTRLLTTRGKNDPPIIKLWKLLNKNKNNVSLENILNNQTDRDNLINFLYNNLDIFFNSLKSISIQNKEQSSFTFDSKKKDSEYVLNYFWIIAFILLLRDIFSGQYKELSKIIIKDDYQEELRKFYIDKLQDLSNNKELFSVSSSGSKYASAAKNIYLKYFKVELTN